MLWRGEGAGDGVLAQPKEYKTCLQKLKQSYNNVILQFPNDIVLLYHVDYIKCYELHSRSVVHVSELKDFDYSINQLRWFAWGTTRKLF